MDSSHKNLQYQHTFTELEYSRKALSNARLHRYGSSSPLTKESTDDNYEARVFNNPDERNFENQSSFINAESQSDFRPPPQQLYSNIKRELPYCDFYATSPIFSNLDHLSDDGKQMLTYGTKCVSGHSNYMDRSPCSSSDTVRRFNSTTRNTTPLPSKMILMVYGYKSMLLSTSSLLHEQPALILNIKSDLKYKDVMRIISDFFLETPKALSVQEPHLNTTHTLSTCSPTISTTADRGSKDYNSSLWGTALGRRGTMGRHWVDIYYLHPVLKIWRFVKHRAVWSAAVLLSLESKKPLRVMISQNYEEEIRENFSPKSPEGMHYERRLARSMGDPKKLLPLFNADVHYQQGSSKLISTFRHSVEAQKTKRNSLLEDNSVCKISPFIIAQKEKHQSPVMKSLKQQKMGSIVGRKERYSSYESNFIIQQKFGGFLPRKGNSKADMKYPQDNRATPSSVISKSYAQPYVSISNDSIHVANFN